MLSSDERVGCLTYVVHDASVLAAVRSQMELIARQTWSNSPNHGARIVATVLNNNSFYEEWSVHLSKYSYSGKIVLKKMYHYP